MVGDTEEDTGLWKVYLDCGVWDGDICSRALQYLLRCPWLRLDVDKCGGDRCYAGVPNEVNCWMVYLLVSAA